MQTFLQLCGHLQSVAECVRGCMPCTLQTLRRAFLITLQQPTQTLTCASWLHANIHISTRVDVQVCRRGGAPAAGSNLEPNKAARGRKGRGQAACAGRKPELTPQAGCSARTLESHMRRCTHAVHDRASPYAQRQACSAWDPCIGSCRPSDHAGDRAFVWMCHTRAGTSIWTDRIR